MVRSTDSEIDAYAAIPRNRFELSVRDSISKFENEGDDIKYSHKTAMPIHWMTSRLGVAASLGILVVATLSAAAWCLGTGFGSSRSLRIVPIHFTPFSRPNATPSPSTDILYRQKDIKYRAVAVRLLELRYAQSERSEYRLSRRRRRHHLAGPLFQLKHLAAALSIDGAVDCVNLSRLAPGDIAGSLGEWTNGIFLGTTAPAAIAGDSVPAAGWSLIGGDETGALALSGGAIADISKVAVNANGNVQFSVAPDWSFITKLDGEFAPAPQIYAATAALNHTW